MDPCQGRGTEMAKDWPQLQVRQKAAEAACVAVDVGRVAGCGLGAFGNDGDRPKRLRYDAPVRNAVVDGVLESIFKRRGGVQSRATWWESELWRNAG